MKLFLILNTFDNKQRSGFLTYVMLYHKPESIIYTIAEWLHTSKVWKLKSSEGCSSEKLLKDSPFTFRLQTFSNAIATLGNLAEEYLGWMVWKKSPQKHRSCQLTGLVQNSLTDLYVKKQKEEFSTSTKNSITIWDEYYKMRTLFNNYYYAVSPSDNKYKKEFSDLLISMQKATSTIAQILLVEIKNREKLLAESWYDYKEFFELTSKVDTKLRKIAEHLILMNNHADRSSYKYLMDIIMTDKRKRLSKHMQYSIVAYTENYLLGVTKLGEDRAHELLKLYEHSIKHEFYTLNDTISLSNFVNIIGVASKLGKDQWARKLVDNWAYKVDKNNIRSIYKFGHATIDFHQKKYEKVIHALAQMKSSNSHHRLSSRWLYLRAQFELNKDYIDAIKTQISNFRRFIIANNSKINKQTFEGLKAALKILNMLLDKKDNNQIRTYYKESKFVFERKWIVEKIKTQSN